MTGGTFNPIDAAGCVTASGEAAALGETLVLGRA